VLSIQSVLCREDLWTYWRRVRQRFPEAMAWFHFNFQHFSTKKYLI
jgi:hypothetical protein